MYQLFNVLIFTHTCKNTDNVLVKERFDPLPNANRELQSGKGSSSLPAECSGVRPLLLVVSQQLELVLRRKRTTSGQPSLQARWKGVQPSLLVRLRDAP